MKASLKRQILAFPVAALIAASASGPVLAMDSSEEVVARLGTTEVKATEIKDFIRGLDPAMRQQLVKDPQALGRLVLARTAILAEAKEKHWDQQPEIAAQIERMRLQTVFATYLASVAAPPAAFPSEAELQTAYEQNRERFVTPRQYHLAQIFVARDRKTDEEARKKAEDLVAKARSKAIGFEELARKNSDLPDAAKTGGDAGWLADQQLLPEIRTAIAGLQKNEISNPIRSQAGWHVIQLLDTKPPAQQSLNEVRDALKQGMRQKKLEENEQTYIAGLLDTKHAVINEIALSKLLEQVK